MARPKTIHTKRTPEVVEQILSAIEDGTPLRKACGDEAVAAIDAGKIATALMGDSIATNMFMLGYAFQRGWVPLPEDALLPRYKGGPSLRGVGTATTIGMVVTDAALTEISHPPMLAGSSMSVNSGDELSRRCDR